MPEVFSQIGSFLGSTTGKGVVGGGAAGAGLLQNFLANRQAEKKQKFVQDLVTNPAKFSAYVSSLQKPLSKGLTTEIGRQTDAYGGERGLGSSPAIMKDVYAQALAPYEQNEQQMALHQALEGLGIYENSPTKKPVDMTSLLKMFMGGGGGSKPGPFSTVPSAVLGGAPGGQIPQETSPTADHIPEETPFDFSNLVSNGAFAGAF